MWEREFVEVCSVAVRQLGLVTGGQLKRLGTTAERAWVEAGLLAELDWSVFQIVGSPTGPMRAIPYAAWLALAPEQFAWERGRDMVISHGSAARLHGIGSASAPVVTITSTGQLPALRAIRVMAAELSADQRTEVDGIPVTTPVRTIHDLVADGIDHDELRDVIRDAVQRDLIDLLDLHLKIRTVAADRGIPADGPSFVASLVGDQDVDELSVRNQRALAELVLPSEVAALTEALRRTFQQVPTQAGSDILRDLAAEAIARTSAR
ncbi:hypothetical protein [Kribbella sp. NPDC006257]|uniref:hypothetical protein n=1 Tax=Kribbella sp. NPDC006257 TaxID=3156738 RepID=UPI0033BA490D